MERLVFVSGPMQGRVVDLSASEISVGREPGNRLQLLGDRCVSRRHARFVRSSNGLTVEDLNSRNGTYVNGRKISGMVPIGPGDQIQIAYHLARVEWSPAAFGPSHPEAVSLAAASVQDRTWLLGLIPSLLLAPVGVLVYRLTGFALLPFALVLAGMALAFAGLIRFYRPTGETSAFEKAFIQTLIGSLIVILGALWLHAIR